MTRRGPGRPSNASAGRWSADHAACAGCSTTTRPHHAGGLCRACYERQRREAAPEPSARELKRRRAARAEYMRRWRERP